jgi:transposase
VRTGTAATFPRRVRESVEQRADFVERQLCAIEAVTEQVAAANQTIAEFAAATDICKRLMTVPGVGPLTAVRFLAVIDEIARFDNAHALQSYLGLVPGESSSGQRKHRTSITKAGSPALRWNLVQAAWVIKMHIKRRPDPMALWSERIEKRRGRQISAVALARKLAGVLYAIWRDGSVYQPQRMLPEAKKED